MRIFKIVAGVMLALCAVAQASADDQAAIAIAHPVYVMRHLQKASGDDPQLTAEGAANAQLLAGLLSASGIKAVFATATRRAQQTAAPLAAAAGVPVTTYDPRNVDALAGAVAAAAGPSLVVGHSNTVPDLVAAFGGAKPAALSEDQYGTIFVVEPGKSDVRQWKLAGGERG